MWNDKKMVVQNTKEMIAVKKDQIDIKKLLKITAISLQEDLRF